MALTFRGGVSLYCGGNTRDKQTRIFDAPSTVCVYVPEGRTPTVKKGDTVSIGQVIGDGRGSRVHASISGSVTAIEEIISDTGVTAYNIIIKNDGESRYSADIKPYDGSFEDIDFEVVSDVMRRCGIDTQTLESAKGRVDRLIVNCVECDPYVTLNRRLLSEDADKVIGGMKILLRALGLRYGDIAIEDNNPDIIKSVRDRVADGGYAEVKVVKCRYPQADPRLLVYALTAKEIGYGKTPEDEGCVIFDARTCADVYDAFVYGMPLVSRTVTVDGDSVTEPGCVRCPVGTSAQELIELCKGSTDGRYTVSSASVSADPGESKIERIDKDTTALIVFADEGRATAQVSSCIRCGRCVAVCPMRLMPNYLAAYSNEASYELCRSYGIMSCIECGCCSYVCPGHMPIPRLIRKAKAAIEEAKGGKENEELK